MERRIGLIAILIGAFWIVSFIAALILGLTFIGGIEDTVLAPVDFIRNLDKLDWFEGPLKGLAIDPQKMEQAKQVYYRLLGWDSSGVPTKTKLQELGIEWAAEYLPEKL